MTNILRMAFLSQWRIRREGKGFFFKSDYKPLPKNVIATAKSPKFEEEKNHVAFKEIPVSCHFCILQRRSCFITISIIWYIIQILKSFKRKPWGKRICYCIYEIQTTSASYVSKHIISLHQCNFTGSKKLY